MIVLDTNVLSELMNPNPEPTVDAWVGSKHKDLLFITSVTKAEILFGLEVMSDGKRRRALLSAAHGYFDEDFAGRILPFDSESAELYARICSDRRASGRPISQLDAQIAAIVRSHGAPVATRNVKDFTGCGVEVINPWEA